VSVAEPVTLEVAGAEHAPLLANLLELCSHDLSGLYGLEVGPDGRFGYSQLALYWSEPEKRRAFLIRRGGQVAGFILVRLDSPLAGIPADPDVSEFFVRRRIHAEPNLSCGPRLARLRILGSASSRPVTPAQPRGDERGRGRLAAGTARESRALDAGTSHPVRGVGVRRAAPASRTIPDSFLACLFAASAAL
jgi:hypothetical protein